jgi:hypothetical protein
MTGHGNLLADGITAELAECHAVPCRLKRPLIRDVRWVFQLVQGQACSGEAALDEAGLVLDLLQGVPGCVA